MFVDDFVMREIQRIAQLVAQLADRDRGAPEDDDEATRVDVEEELLRAYRSLLGFDRSMVDTFTGDTLARMVPDPDRSRALVSLLIAHGDHERAGGDETAAGRLYDKAAQALREHGADAELEAALRERG